MMRNGETNSRMRGQKSKRIGKAMDEDRKGKAKKHHYPFLAKKTKKGVKCAPSSIYWDKLYRPLDSHPFTLLFVAIGDGITTQTDVYIHIYKNLLPYPHRCRTS